MELVLRFAACNSLENFFFRGIYGLSISHTQPRALGRVFSFAQIQAQTPLLVC